MNQTTTKNGFQVLTLYLGVDSLSEMKTVSNTKNKMACKMCFETITLSVCFLISRG